MAVITINGQIGSGASEIGARVAEELGCDYVDRLILAEAAKRTGIPVGEAMAEERRPQSRRERVMSFLESALTRSVMGGNVDPYLGGLMGLDYQQVMEQPAGDSPTGVNRFIEATVGVVRELAAKGGVVIVSRASNLILKDDPGAFHVGLVSTLESRIRVVARREGIDESESRRAVEAQEKARQAFFRRYFGGTVDNPADYHIMLNTHLLGIQESARVVTQALSRLPHTA